MPRAEFIQTFGGIFEHSPWIAEHTAGPFEDINDLFVRLCETVSGATDEQKLALIRAHPDLVGKLAKQGKLTKESTAEQKAAGLMSLSGRRGEAIRNVQRSVPREIRLPFCDLCKRK